MRLLLVELSRLRSRRAIMVLMAGAFLVGALVAGATLWEHRPLDDAAIASGEEFAAREAQQPYFQRIYRRCQENPAQFSERGVATVSDCEMVLPDPAWYLERQPLDPVDLSGQLPLVLTLFLGVIAVLVGATMIGAEWSAGSVGTQLLFEPRRPLVWTAKAIAIAVSAAVMAAVVFAFVWLAILGAYTAWSDDALPAGFVGDLGETGLRAAAFAAVAGLAGYAVTVAVRHTVVVVGLMLAYSVIGEGLLRSLFPSVERYLVSNNAVAWIDKSHTIVVYPQDCFDDVSCRPDKIVLELLDAAVYFGGITAVLLTASLFVFSTRDVP